MFEKNSPPRSGSTEKREHISEIGDALGQLNHAALDNLTAEDLRMFGYELSRVNALVDRLYRIRVEQSHAR